MVSGLMVGFGDVKSLQNDSVSSSICLTTYTFSLSATLIHRSEKLYVASHCPYLKRRQHFRTLSHEIRTQCVLGLLDIGLLVQEMPPCDSQ